MKKENKIKNLFIIAGLMIAICVVFFFMQKNRNVYRSVKIVEMQGDVTIERDGKGQLMASVNMNLIPGDYIQTGKDSYTVLLLDTDKYIMLEEYGRIQMNAYGNAEEGKTSITLVKGNVLNEIQNHLAENDSFEVITPNATMSVRGTVFEIRKSKDGLIDVAVFDGAVGVAFPGQEESLVQQGEYTSFTDEETPKIVVEKGDIADFPVSPQVNERLMQIQESGREIALSNVIDGSQSTKKSNKGSNSGNSNSSTNDSQNEEKSEVTETKADDKTITTVSVKPADPETQKALVATEPIAPADTPVDVSLQSVQETPVTNSLTADKAAVASTTNVTSGTTGTSGSSSHSSSTDNNRPPRKPYVLKYLGYYVKGEDFIAYNENIDSENPDSETPDLEIPDSDNPEADNSENEVHKLVLITKDDAENLKNSGKKIYSEYELNGVKYIPVVFVVSGVKVEGEAEDETEDETEDVVIEEETIIEYYIHSRENSGISIEITPDYVRDENHITVPEEGSNQVWYIDVVTTDEDGTVHVESRPWDYETDKITEPTYLYAGNKPEDTEDHSESEEEQSEVTEEDLSIVSEEDLSIVSEEGQSPASEESQSSISEEVQSLASEESQSLASEESQSSASEESQSSASEESQSSASEESQSPISEED